MLPDAFEVRSRLERAVSTFKVREHSLIRWDPSERSLTHRLAVSIEAEFPGWDVDCEYNRVGRLPKQLKGLVPEHARTDDEDADTVFPDIIVHRRGPEGPNLLVVEAKKATSRASADKDKCKLKCYRNELSYQHAAFILLPAGEKEGAAIEWIEQDV